MITFKINVSSIVDIITNSSSEIFTIQSSKSRAFIIDAINCFCKSIDFKFQVDESDFPNPELNWEFEDAVETLKKFGYKAVKVDTDGCFLKLSFSNECGFSDKHEQLFHFLENTLNAERSYD